MNFEQYMNEVNRLRFDLDMSRPDSSLLTHAALGIAGEGGEVVDLVKKYLTRKIDNRDQLRTKLKEEVGDLLWYLALLLSTVQLSLDEVTEFNVDKLNKRHPNKMMGGEG